MVGTELGPCEWFVWDLRRSNLVDRGQLDQLVGEFLKKKPNSEAPALAEYLVGQTILTQFQADRLLQGKSQGLVLGPYRLMDALGTGSMGTVYKAQSKTDNKWYAVKVLPRRSMWNVRIARRQVRIFEQCKHPAVVPFVDVGTAGGMHYLAWPLVEGESLDNLVQRVGRLDPAQTAYYALQIAEGLNDCHQNQLVHGLLKPSNVMIGADQNVRILDFGIGSLLAESEGESLVDTMSTANSLTSGLDCTSPESIMEPTNRTQAGDQYSLGCVLYYCLAGQYPFADGSAVEKMMAHQTKQPTPLRDLNPDVSEDLAGVVERLMQKAPEARYARCAEIIAALQPLAGEGRPSSWSTARLMPAPAARVEPARPQTNGVSAEPVSVTRRDVPVSPPSDPRPPSHQGFALPSRAELFRKPDAPPTPRPTAPEPPAQTNPAAGRDPDQKPYRSLEERLGTGGIFLGALLIGALTWLVTVYLKH